MKRHIGQYAVTVGATGLLTFLLLTSVGDKRGGRVSQAWGQISDVPSLVTTPQNVIQAWPEMPKKVAGVIVEKYGQPNHFNNESLVWYGNGPWKRTVVYRDGWLDQASIRHAEVLQQVITYSVPNDKVKDLSRYDERLVIDGPRQELSFVSDSEKTNFLAINMADEVVSLWKTVEQARAFAAKTARLSEAGKKSVYTDGFRFKVENDLTPIQD